eukprot:SAG11_NODE_189_length_13028_cov_14.222446_10_plen_78_part_00
MGRQRRLAHLASQITRCAAQSARPLHAKDASDSALPERPWGQSDVRPTDDPAMALDDFRREGFCVLKDVLSLEEVQM